MSGHSIVSHRHHASVHSMGRESIKGSEGASAEGRTWSPLSRPALSPLSSTQAMTSQEREAHLIPSYQRCIPFTVSSVQQHMETSPVLTLGNYNMHISGVTNHHLQQQQQVRVSIEHSSLSISSVNVITPTSSKSILTPQCNHQEFTIVEFCSLSPSKAL